MFFRSSSFQRKDILDIKKSLKKIIITTEKDYAITGKNTSDQFFYLPIKVNLLKEMSNLEQL
jgi:hypothetical protein